MRANESRETPMTGRLAKELEIRLTAVEKQLKEMAGAIECHVSQL